MTTALLLVDLQTWIVGMPLAPLSGEEIATRCAALAARHRRSGPVVMIRYLDVDGPGADSESLRNAFVPAVAPVEDDLVITKHGLDAFDSTPLAQALTRRGVDRVKIAGIATAFGVAATARGAVRHGLSVAVVADATSSGSVAEHERALADLAAVATIC